MKNLKYFDLICLILQLISRVCSIAPLCVNELNLGFLVCIKIKDCNWVKIFEMYVTSDKDKDKDNKILLN